VEEPVRRSDRSVSFFIWFSLFLAVGAFFLVLLTSASREYRKVEAKRKEVEKRYARAREKVERLQLEIYALQTDPAAIEREARRSLNYARPGEVSYKREDIPIIPPRSSGGSRGKQLSIFIQRDLKDWQVPLIVFGVIVAALVILRLFRAGDEDMLGGSEG